MKLKLTENFYKKNKINILADLGCNDGKFSFYAAKNNIDVVGFDFDLNVLDRIYNLAKKKFKISSIIFLIFQTRVQILVGMSLKERV